MCDDQDPPPNQLQYLLVQALTMVYDGIMMVIERVTSHGRKVRPGTARKVVNGTPQFKSKRVRIVTDVALSVIEKIYQNVLRFRAKTYCDSI